jgi:hypothetical protein
MGVAEGNQDVLVEASMNPSDLLEIILSVVATFSAVVIGVGLICIGMSNFIEWMDAE